MKRWVAFSFCLFFLLPSGVTAQQTPTIPMYIFYANDCPSCQAILQSYVPTLQAQYPFLNIKTFELGDPSNYEALAKLEERFNRRGEERVDGGGFPWAIGPPSYRKRF